jgi:enamine deaminase RidA (YjgF/YER057c/UK114 family)
MPLLRINPPALSKPTGYSHAVEVSAGRQLHISGQVSLDASGQIVGEGDITQQTEQVFQNLKAALARAAAIRKVRLSHLSSDAAPASTMVGTTALVHPDLLIEIEAIALLD